MKKNIEIVTWPLLLLLVSCSASSSSSSTSSAVSTFGVVQLGASGGQSMGAAVAADNLGNTYVAGHTTVGLGGNSLLGNRDAFLAKYNESGTLLWLKELGATGGQVFAYSLAFDASSGALYVAGETNVGLGMNSQSGNDDYYVAKYNSAGTLLWVTQLGASGGASEAAWVASDSAGNVYVVGNTSVALGGGNTQTGNGDYFIAKYNSSGQLQWIKQNGVASSTSDAASVAVNSNGVYMVGVTTGAFPLNTQTGNVDGFFAGYSSAGSLSWLEQFGSSGSSTYADQIVTDSSGNVYFTGSTSGPLFGNTQNGTQDAYIAKFSSGGTYAWLKQTGTATYVTVGEGLQLDASGNLYVAGYSTVGGAGDVVYTAKFTNAGALDWAQTLGPALGNAVGNGLAYDAYGFLKVTGYTTGALDGSTQSGNYDVFLASYDSSGNLQ